MLIETTGDASPHHVERILRQVEALGLRSRVVNRDAGSAAPEAAGPIILVSPRSGHLLPTGEDPDGEDIRHRLGQLDAVLRVRPLTSTSPMVARQPAADGPRIPTTPVRLGPGPGQVVGGEALALVAGPCSVEGLPMILETARAVRSAGAGMLRGGAFKPRTSPYAFQGLGEAALDMLARARAETGLAIVTEVMDPRQAVRVAACADVLQIGARNMQNFDLLREVGMLGRPVLLKRGASATLGEFILAAEHVMAAGAEEVILCERGIRTFETATRNTLDVSAIPVLRRETHLPVVVDPSHAGGIAELVAPLAFAGIAAGADGLMIEVHPEPARAWSDGAQSLTPDAFHDLVRRMRPFAEAAGRTLPMPVTADTAASRLRGVA